MTDHVRCPSCAKVLPTWWSAFWHTISTGHPIRDHADGEAVLRTHGDLSVEESKAVVRNQHKAVLEWARRDRILKTAPSWGRNPIKRFAWSWANLWFPKAPE
jgi:DNA-directed RNA polymerase subunit N (RpoN/RPB10)